MRISLRSASLVIALAAASIASLTGTSPALASHPSAGVEHAAHTNLKPPRITGAACTSEDGVTVVVDFRNLLNAQGRKMNLVKIGCAEQPVGNGFDALLGAGFHVDPSQQFVCTIDDRPIDLGSCPPPDGFWSYSHGLRGKHWKASGVGAGDWKPPAGSLEGWSWAPFGHTPPWYNPRVSPQDLFPSALR